MFYIYIYIYGILIITLGIFIYVNALCLITHVFNNDVFEVHL